MTVTVPRPRTGPARFLPTWGGPEPDRFAAWLRASRLARYLQESGVEAAVRRAQQADARRPAVLDTALALGLIVIGLPRLVLIPGHRYPADWIVQFTMLLALTLRRRAPFGVFLVVSAAALAEYVIGTPLPVANFGLLAALYSVASRSSLAKVLAALAVAETGAVLAAHAWASGDSAPRMFVFVSGMVVAAAVLGLNTRTRRAYLASLEERARQLELERDRQAEIAAAAERALIAREVHDIVTHSLSVMVALTDGASFAVHSAPDKAADALGKASDVGRQAIADMQRVLGVLRTRAAAGPDLAPQPGLGQLDALLAEVRAAGLPVELVVGGAVAELSSGVELAVFRVVQEALTNTRKHGGAGTRARVDLRYGAGAVEVTVVDDGEGGGGGGGEGGGGAAGGGSAGSGGGHGLAGMRERAAAFGGTVAAGPREDGGGWYVQARFPAGSDELAPDGLRGAAR